MVRALEEKLGVALNNSPDAQYVGALGAALFALDHVLAGQSHTVDARSEPSVWVDE
jgi:activator of 2-hydroxyglutaryl-CoA dehydratase